MSIQTAVESFVNQLNEYSNANHDGYYTYSYTKGKSYYKLLTSANGTSKSSYAFIVAKEDDKKFQQGDILKAASWSAPAKNKARGNILNGNYTVDETSFYSYN